MKAKKFLCSLIVGTALMTSNVNASGIPVGWTRKAYAIPVVPTGPPFDEEIDLYWGRDDNEKRIIDFSHCAAYAFFLLERDSGCGRRPHLRTVLPAL